MRASSMASVSARRSGSVTGTTTWPISRPNSWRQAMRDSNSSPQTASSQWTAPSRSSGHLRSRGEARRIGHGGRFARRGVHGQTGRGTHEHCDVMGRVDILTGTLGKALGGASGAIRAGARRSSNSCDSARALTCSPTALRRESRGASLEALSLLKQSTVLRDKLEATRTSSAER